MKNKNFDLNHLKELKKNTDALWDRLYQISIQGKIDWLYINEIMKISNHLDSILLKTKYRNHLFQ